MKSPYWQHNAPIKCPKRHVMTWLGSAFWICSRCRTIYVQQPLQRDTPAEEN